MQRRKIKNLNSTAFLVFLLMPFFKPGSLQLIAPLIDSIFDGWRLVSFLIVAVLYLMAKKPSKTIVSIICFQLALLLSTIINSEDYWKFTVTCGGVVGFSMLTELCICQNSKKYFSVVFKIYLVLICIHFVVLMLFPDGIAADKYYVYSSIYGFLGTDNGMPVSVSLPLIGIACLYSAFKGRKYTYSSLTLIVLISAITLIAWSATGVTAWFVLIAYILFVYKKPYARFFNSYILFTVFIVMQIAIVFLRLQDSFAFIIEDILGKTLDFTGRTTVWDSTLLLIARAPIFGYGVYKAHGLVKLGSWYVFSHNSILEVLVQGGVVGLILIIVPYVVAAKELYHNRNHFLAGIVTATVFSFMVDFLMETSYVQIWVYGYLVIGANISTVIEQYEDLVSRKNEKMIYLRRPIIL